MDAMDAMYVCMHVCVCVEECKTQKDGKGMRGICLHVSECVGRKMVAGWGRVRIRTAEEEGGWFLSEQRYLIKYAAEASAVFP